MQLKIITLLTILIGLNLFASESWKLESRKDKVFLVKGSAQISIEGSSLSKLEKVYKKDGYTIIEYYRGEVGTSTMLNIHQRIVLDIETNSILANAPYRYAGEPTSEQPVWNFKLKDKVIEIKDPFGVDQKVKLK